MKFVLKRNGVTLRTTKVDLNKFGVGKLVFNDVNKAGRYSQTARDLGTTTLKRSVDRVKLTV